ncbi:hypothetical protein BDN70DRAFT_783077, partial [Pholiota conissans]
ILNWGLFGVLSIQVWYTKDRPLLKTLVFGIYILDIIKTVLLTQTAWNMLVKGFGKIESLDEVGTTFISVCLLSGIGASFYAWRIMIISERKIIPAVICI